MNFERHGGPYDRGSADSFYGRPFNPHYFEGATYSTPKVEAADMSEEELVAYSKGFFDNEESGLKKEWD